MTCHICGRAVSIDELGPKCECAEDLDNFKKRNDELEAFYFARCGEPPISEVDAENDRLRSKLKESEALVHTLTQKGKEAAEAYNELAANFKVVDHDRNTLAARVLGLEVENAAILTQRNEALSLIGAVVFAHDGEVRIPDLALRVGYAFESHRDSIHHETIIRVVAE